MIDASVAVQKYLASVTALTELVSTRIYSVTLPETFKTAAKAVLFFQVPGGQTGRLAGGVRVWDEVTYQAHCIGTTEAEARAVWLALRDAILAISWTMVSGYTLIRGIEDPVATDGADPETKWPRVVGQFTVQVKC